jgi:hypothetical protein
MIPETELGLSVRELSSNSYGLKFSGDGGLGPGGLGSGYGLSSSFFFKVTAKIIAKITTNKKIPPPIKIFLFLLFEPSFVFLYYPKSFSEFS